MSAREVAHSKGGRTSVEAVHVPAGEVTLEGDLRVPGTPCGLVIFAHGSGSSRFSGRNRHVAEILGGHGLATLLLDLLTQDEAVVDEVTREHRFDLARLGPRVTAAIDWAARRPDLAALPIGCFGASTGAAAALMAAAERPAVVQAVVSRGGRPDLAGHSLPRVAAPTLLIVGGLDEEVLSLNRAAACRMHAPVEVEVVPDATHLFEEPGTLDRVAQLASTWFTRHFGGAARRSIP